MLVSRRPGVGRPAGDRSYSPSMLFRWMPVPGTITPEPEPVEEESDAALPVGVDDGHVRRAAGGRWLDDARRSGLDPREPAADPLVARAGAARARRGAGRCEARPRGRASARA